MRMKLAGLVLGLMVAASALAVNKSASKNQPWVSQDAAGHLIYKTLPRGDRIVDFSYAGYRGGGVPLPSRIPIARTVEPSGADDSAAIQKAIDEVSAMPLINGLRGAVVLKPGTFQCSATLRIAASGVVLHGSGPSDGGTTIKLTGAPHWAIDITGKQEVKVVGTPAHLAQAYLPSGSMTITVDDASAFSPGDTIRITRITTDAWLHFMGMDKMVRDGKQESWVGPRIATLRTVKARNGDELTLDVPLTDSYDRAYMQPEGAEVAKVSVTGAVEEDAVEGLHIVAPARTVSLDDPLFGMMEISGVRDGWVRDLLVDDTTNGIDITTNSARITVENVVFRHKTAINSPAKPADFGLRGTQILVYKCGSSGNNLFYAWTGARNQGPNVVLDSEFHGDGRIQAHQRWSTGLLVDNTRVPQGGIDLKNRGEMGTGHGWAMGWGVVWNSSAASLVIQNPPGAANWSIGTTGDEQREAMKIMGVRHVDAGPPLPQGFIESPNHRVLPESLYRAQLVERLGPSALNALEP